jgi:hypothetical protein
LAVAGSPVVFQEELMEQFPEFLLSKMAPLCACKSVKLNVEILAIVGGLLFLRLTDPLLPPFSPSAQLLIPYGSCNICISTHLFCVRTLEIHLILL